MTHEEIANWRNVAANPDAKELPAAEYLTVTTEIRGRVEHEHLLFALKFALVGGILFAALQGILARPGGVTLERTSFTALVVWAAVLAAALVDLRIAANQEFIRSLGRCVRRYEELQFGVDAATLGWEGFLAREPVHTRRAPCRSGTATPRSSSARCWPRVYAGIGVLACILAATLARASHETSLDSTPRPSTPSPPPP